MNNSGVKTCRIYLAVYNVLYLCISQLLGEAWMFLEHPASDNGADMHKYNTLYTYGLICMF